MSYKIKTELDVYEMIELYSILQKAWGMQELYVELQNTLTTEYNIRLDEVVPDSLINIDRAGLREYSKSKVKN